MRQSVSYSQLPAMTLTKRLFILLLTSVCTAVIGQNKLPETIYKDAKYKYSFKVDTTFWIKAGPEKVARKVNYDKEKRGIDSKYEYIFTTNNNPIINRPFFTITLNPTEKNYFEEFKTNFNQKAKLARIKNQDIFPDIKRILSEKSTMVNEELKSIIFLTTHIKEDITYYSMNCLYFTDNYILTFVLSTENLEEVYSKYTDVLQSTKFD